MRHFYFRLFFAIVWLAGAVISAVGANRFSAALYVILGIIFLWSAYAAWKKEKENRG